MARAFKVRSSERDARTDMERFGSLARSISSTIEAVQSEKNALRTRVDEARDYAALVAGTGSNEHLDRDAADLAQLRSYEQEMKTGDLRLRELERQLDGLDQIRETYEQFFAGFASAKPR